MVLLLQSSMSPTMQQRWAATSVQFVASVGPAQSSLAPSRHASQAVSHAVASVSHDSRAAYMRNDNFVFVTE